MWFKHKKDTEDWMEEVRLRLFEITCGSRAVKRNTKMENNRLRLFEITCGSRIGLLEPILTMASASGFLKSHVVQVNRSRFSSKSSLPPQAF